MVWRRLAFAACLFFFVRAFVSGQSYAAVVDNSVRTVFCGMVMGEEVPLGLPFLGCW